jgi:hypothetical protein
MSGDPVNWPAPPPRERSWGPRPVDRGTYCPECRWWVWATDNDSLRLYHRHWWREHELHNWSA